MSKLQHPDAYWDRTGKVPRSMYNNDPLPNYVGIILVYMDVTGPKLMNTFFIDGRRAWVPLTDGSYITSETIEKATQL